MKKMQQWNVEWKRLQQRYKQQRKMQRTYTTYHYPHDLNAEQIEETLLGVLLGQDSSGQIGGERRVSNPNWLNLKFWDDSGAMYVCQLGADLPNLASLPSSSSHFVVITKTSSAKASPPPFIANSKNPRGAGDLRCSWIKHQLEFTRLCWNCPQKYCAWKQTFCMCKFSPSPP